MKERRFVKGTEVRAAKETGHIDGHAAVFNEKYTLMDYPDLRVDEIIKPGAFARAIKERQDVRALFNHNPSFLLGRTTNDTLTLKEDRQGLYFDNTPPETQTGRDVRALIERGDVTGCSFAFEVIKQTRTEEMVGKQLVVTRTVEDVNLFDVGPVTYPAYESTDVNARQIDFRGLFPNGYPEPLRRHMGDLGLPPDLQPRENTEELKAQVAELQVTITGQRALLEQAQSRQAAAETEAQEAKQKLEAVRTSATTEAKNFEAGFARFKEEKTGLAAWVRRMSEGMQTVAANCRSGLAEVKKRAQLAAGIQNKLQVCQEHLISLEKAIGEERALLTASESAPEWTKLAESLQESIRRESDFGEKLKHRSETLAVFEEKLAGLVAALGQERALLVGTEAIDWAAVPLSQVPEMIKRAGDMIAKIQQRAGSLKLLEEKIGMLIDSLKQERAGVVLVDSDWNPVLTQLKESTQRDAAITSKIAQRGTALAKLEKQLSEERTALQQIQGVDPNWKLVTDDLEKGLKQSEEAIAELTRRTRLWE